MAAADQSKKSVSSESDRNDMSVNSRNLYDRSDPVQRIFFGLTQYVLNFPLLKMGPLHSAVSYIVHWLKDYLSNQNILIATDFFTKKTIKDINSDKMGIIKP